MPDPRREAPHPLLELTLVRLRELVREKEALFWVFVFPILLALALGVAFRESAQGAVRVGVTGEDRAAVASSLRAAEGIDAIEMTPAEAAAELRTGKVALVVSPAPPGQPVELAYDPARPESRLARLLVDDALEAAAGRRDVVEKRERTVREPGARYIDWLIPGLIGMNIMGTGMWGSGFAVVNARTGKLLKRLAATPMRRAHYLLSFVLSRLVFLLLEVSVVVAFARLAFGVTVAGSYLSLAMVALIGAFAFSGLGLLVGARTKTIEGVSGLMNLVMLPMWLLSGTFFSSSRFPDALRPVIQALPLTALNDALRGVINEGATLTGPTGMGVELAGLAAWCVASFVLALRLFRWQ